MPLPFLVLNLLDRNGSSKSTASAYIRISPEEIADDYPVPASYEKVVQESSWQFLLLIPAFISFIQPRLIQASIALYL
jgi:hypothetical protein